MWHTLTHLIHYWLNLFLRISLTCCLGVNSFATFSPGWILDGVVHISRDSTKEAFLFFYSADLYSHLEAVGRNFSFTETASIKGPCNFTFVEQSFNIFFPPETELRSFRPSLDNQHRVEDYSNNCLNINSNFSKEKFWLKPPRLHIFNEKIWSECTTFR